MAKPALTYEICLAAGTDAGDRSMRDGGRVKWSKKDRDAAARTTNRLLEQMERSLPPEHRRWTLPKGHPLRGGSRGLKGESKTSPLSDRETRLIINARGCCEMLDLWFNRLHSLGLVSLNGPDCGRLNALKMSLNQYESELSDLDWSNHVFGGDPIKRGRPS